MTTWELEGIQLSPLARTCITRLGFAKPTPVQAATIPRFLSHKDVVVEAVTGSGKTLAFLLPLLEMLWAKQQAGALADRQRLGALVIAPTRELASQTFHILGELLHGMPDLSRILLIGGADVALDLSRVRAEGCNIIVGTPGRILAIMERMDESAFKSLELLVLDEADRLLNMGFQPTLTAILEKLPKQRRTGLFSATMSDALAELVRTGLRNPVRITVKVENRQTREECKMPESLQSRYLLCEYEHRLPAVLQHVATHPTAQKSIVYFATCASVDYFTLALPLLVGEATTGADADSNPPPSLDTYSFLASLPKLFALHGRMEQKKRQRIYQEYLAAPRALLLCTDVAARGLDFVDVDLVIQYEAPQDPTTFVHRCGRTARIGRSGEALLLLAESEDAYVDFLENRKVPLSPLGPNEAGSLSCPPTDMSLFHTLRRLNASDRALYEKSVCAFVAFVRFYQEHQTKFIFRLKDVNLVSVARSLGLLRWPKMRELQGLRLEGLEWSDVDIFTIPYKDPSRNKQWVATMQARREAKTTGSAKALSRSSCRGRGGSRGGGRPSTPSQPFNAHDLDELDEDWREYKRMKKGGRAQP